MSDKSRKSGGGALTDLRNTAFFGRVGTGAGKHAPPGPVQIGAAAACNDGRFGACLNTGMAKANFQLGGSPNRCCDRWLARLNSIA